MPTTDPADVARTQQHSRIVALGLGVVAFGAAIALRLMLAPRLDGARYENTLMFLGPGAVALLLFAVHAALFRSASRRRPTAFQLGRVRGRPAFVGAVPPIDHAPVPVFAALATVLVVLDRTPSGDSALPASFVAASVLAAIGAVAAATWFTLFRRPFLVLTPVSCSSAGLADCSKPGRTRSRGMRWPRADRRRPARERSGCWSISDTRPRTERGSSHPPGTAATGWTPGESSSIPRSSRTRSATTATTRPLGPESVRRRATRSSWRR
ncbi:hypothetical protein [Cryptosporangium minutisporangium]|uniref:Uncharacterized protein n=1 Tax=Cryptosporangium minutisporangium TaxID=113569 RepID=A0ABP6SPP7_9ACTN